MRTVTTLSELRAVISRARRENKRIGLVPTMGNLHAGHLALVQTARELTDFVVTSIFVNPLQFSANEDLDKYPRTLQADQEHLVGIGCDVLFLPDVKVMYPHGAAQQTRIVVPEVSEGLCGASRPGHFEGVATVVNKLFNMVQPDLAVFGEKDYQQLAVIRRMVRDLDMPIEIVGHRTVRAEDDLALSSRNGYLTQEQRENAPNLYHHLQDIAARLMAGERDYPRLLEEERGSLEKAGFRPDYLEIRHPQTLQPASADDCQLIILAAAYLGETRLIDNLAVSLD